MNKKITGKQKIQGVFECIIQFFFQFSIQFISNTNKMYMLWNAHNYICLFVFIILYICKFWDLFIYLKLVEVYGPFV